MSDFLKTLKTGKDFWLGGFVVMAVLAGCLTSTDKGGNTNTVPSITVQPSNQTVSTGSTATFSVTATGTAPLYYQWQRNSVDISGATSASYTTPATVVGDNGAQFRCIVSNSVGSATSNAATLQVNASGPAITAQPQDATVIEGVTATFSVTATGGTLYYQWQANGQNIVNGNGISGATTSTLSIASVIASDGGANFRCVVTNATGSVTSNRALLMVNAAVTTMTDTAGAQGNDPNPPGSFVDIDIMRDFTEAEVTFNGNDADIDLFFGYSTTIGAPAIYSPDVARDGIGGAGGGFAIAQSLSPANTTDIRPVSLTLAQFNAISNKSEIDLLWDGATSDADGRLPIANGDTFLARSDLGLIVLIRVSSLAVSGTTSTVILTGTTKF